MSQRTREKQALGVFVLLIVLSTVGVAWYLVAGHSWNVAASSIDERVGQMDGYTSIVFAGTLATEAEQASSPSADGAERSSRNPASPDAAADASTVDGSASTASSNDLQSSSSDGSSSGFAGSGASSGKTSKNVSSGSAASKPSSPATQPEVHADAATGLTSDIDGIAAPVESSRSDSTAEPSDAQPASDASPSSGEAAASSSSAKGSLLVDADPVDPVDVSSNYEGKGAAVLVLDTVNPSVYSDGAIVKRGSKRIGVFYVDVPLSETAAQERIEYFKEAKVDMIVCISSVKAYVRNLAGADIVVTLQDDDVSTMGSTSNGTFFVNAPRVGCVGAILVSPSNVVSAKVVESI